MQNTIDGEIRQFRSIFDDLYNEFINAYDMNRTINRLKFINLVIDTYSKAVKDAARITEDNSFFDLSIHKQIVDIFIDWEFENYIEYVKGECALHGRINMSELQNFIEFGYHD